MATMAATTNEALPEISGYERLIAAGVFIVIAAMAIFGNSLVILAVALSRKLQTTTNIYVVVLAITDLLIAIIQIIQAVMLLSKRKSWFLRKLCTGAAAVNFVLIGCSMGALALIAVYRMRIVTRSFTSKPNAMKVVISIIIVYLLNALGLVAAGFIDHIQFGNFRGLCNYLGGNFTDYGIGIYIFILLIIIIVCYSRIYYHVRHHCHRVAQVEMRRIPHERPGPSGGLNVIGVEQTNRNTFLKVNKCTSLDMVLKGNMRISISKKPISEETSLKTSKLALSTAGSVLELSQKKCEQAESSLPAKPSQRGPRSAPVAPATILESHKVLSLIHPDNLVNQNGQTTELAAMSADFEKKSIYLHQDANINKRTGTSCVNHKILNGSKTAPNVVSFLNRSPNVRIPTKPENPEKSHCVPHQNNLVKAESNITLNMLLLVITYFTCMAPTIVQLFVPGQQDSSWIIFLILFSNCCWNPLIYAWKHPDFRHTFGCILRGKLYRIRNPVPWLRRRISAK